MFTVITHKLAASELEEIPDNLRGKMYALIELLEDEGQHKAPYCRAFDNGLFELRVGDDASEWSLYCRVKERVIYLLYAFLKKGEITPDEASARAWHRLEDFE